MHWESGIFDVKLRILQQSVSISKVIAKIRTHAEFASWTSGSFQISKWEHPSTINAKRAKSMEKPVAKSSVKPEAVTSTSEYKVYHTQPFKRRMMFAEKQSRNWSTNLKHTQIASRWWQTWTRTKNFNLFSEKSKELIRIMRNTEYFEMFEITSKVQCRDCPLSWEVGILYRTCGKCLTPSERDRQLDKDRYDVLSFPIIWWQRIRLMELDTDQLKSNGYITKTTKHSGRQTRKVTKTILARFLNNPIYIDAQIKIGWDENTCIAYDEISKEDHSYVATTCEQSRNENSWKLVLNSEGANGPENQRDDYNEAKKTCNKL